jgi:hypothetical protein
MGATSNTQISKLLIKLDSTSASFKDNFVIGNLYVTPAGISRQLFLRRPDASAL